MPRFLKHVHASPARECCAYLILAFGLTWSVWVPIILASREPEHASYLLVLGSYGPALAALLLSYRGNRIPGSILHPRLTLGVTLLMCWGVLLLHARVWDEAHLSLRMKMLMLLLAAIPAWIASTALSRDGGVRATMRSLLPQGRAIWHGVALLLVPVLLLTTALIARVRGDFLHRPNVSGTGLSIALLLIVEFGYALFFGGGVSEEPGWRGFLLPRLQQRFSPLVASLFLWLPWALWHAPLDYAGYAGSTFTAYLRTRAFILIPVCIILTWLYNRCGGSIFSVALFHSAFNVAPEFVPSAEWADWAIVGLALVLIWIDKMWRKTVRAV